MPLGISVAPENHSIDLTLELRVLWGGPKASIFTFFPSYTENIKFGGAMASLIKSLKNLFVDNKNSPKDGIYEGPLTSDGQRCGQGTLRYFNSDVYVGGFQNNLKHGEG